MKFIDKLKQSFETVTTEIKTMNVQLAKMVKENKAVLKDEAKVAKDNKKAIEFLKNYAEKETPGLNEALIAISDALETVQSNREAMVEQLNVEFIAPMDEVLAKWLALQKQIDAEKTAETKQGKAKKTLAKKQAKPEEKLKPDEIDNAAKVLQESTEEKKKKHEELVQATDDFNTLKIKKMQEVLVALMERYEAFHNQALNIITDAKDTIKHLDINKELNID